MNKIQLENYRMLGTIQNHFESHPEIWASNVLIADAKAKLSAKIGQIDQAGRIQMENSTGATIGKAKLRVELEKKGFFVSTVLSAYANINPGPEPLNKRLQITKYRFTKFRESDLLVAIDELNAAATPIIASLAPYGVTQDTLMELMEAKIAFFNMMNLPDDITATRKNATIMIAQLLREAIELLKSRMDFLMEALRYTETQFFNIYFYERAIHHIGVRKMSLVITTLQANDSAPLAKAEIEVVGHGIKRKSGQSGMNRVQNLKEGHYTLSVTRAGFVPQKIPFSVVHGETTQIVVEMELEEVSKTLSS